VKLLLCFVLTALVLAACDSDVVSSHYATLAQARANQLFDKGWLPDVLPPSTYDIRTSNDVERNTSVGEFRFAPTELLFTRDRKYWERQMHFSPKLSLTTLTMRQKLSAYTAWRSHRVLGIQTSRHIQSASTWLLGL
jgi:hypothetical protein